jgi:hypothetical protein
MLQKTFLEEGVFTRLKFLDEVENRVDCAVFGLLTQLPGLHITCVSKFVMIRKELPKDGNFLLSEGILSRSALEEFDVF